MYSVTVISTRRQHLCLVRTHLPAAKKHGFTIKQGVCDK